VRFALVVAPLDPQLGSDAARRDALAWLRGQLARRGFQVAIVGAGDNPFGDLERAAATVSPADAVLVHVSGQLLGNDAVAMGRAGALPLAGLTDHLVARVPGYVSFILDLVPGEAAGDASDAARSLVAAERGYPVLAAVRPADATERMTFTRMAMPPFDESSGPPSGDELLARMFERAAAIDAHGAQRQDFVFVHGAPDPTIDGRVAAATQAGDWPRVCELRLDRAETLASVGLRVQELSGIARILLTELRDTDGAIEVLEHARSLDPKRATVLETLRNAYETSGRAPPIDPADYVRAFVTHKRAGQADLALLDAMALEELAAAEPEHKAVVEQSRSVGPAQVLKPLDASAWEALRAPGFDPALSTLFAAVHDAAVAARIEQMRSARRLPSLAAGSRLDDESTVSAVRTFHWAARVLGVTCPDLYSETEGAADSVTQVPATRPSISLGPGVLSGMSTKQLAFLAGSSLAWHLPAYHCLLYYPSIEDLAELVSAAFEIAGSDARASVPPGTATEALRRGLARGLDAQQRAVIGDAARELGARGPDIGLEHWARSAALTAARTGLLLCGELRTAVAAVRSQPQSPGRPTAERVTSDLIAFCASRAHADLRAGFVAPSQAGASGVRRA
jgi:hypothetical protein